MPGSVLLLGGEPGIGKSTLLIQACAALAASGRRVVYISGEEAVDQVRLRALRLGLAAAPVELAAETSVEDIVATLSHGKRPSLVVIDSIQTMWTELIESTPGTVCQVRGAAQALIRFAKTTGAAVILVGHVTKDGQIAGPRVVEHMVDAVMSFEGEGGRDLRILRAVKNRFGATDEIGVFEMTGRGLAEVENPSALFLSSRDTTAPGAAVFAGMEGSRPLLVEIQALVAPSPLGMPRRAVVGWDNARLAMVVAVLETHAGVKLGQHDIYLNVAGGLRVGEPAADLAAAAALVSSLSGIGLATDSVFFGEIALSGAIRPVAHGLARLKEAAKLGFYRATIPDGAAENGEAPVRDLTVRGLRPYFGTCCCNSGRKGPIGQEREKSRLKSRRDPQGCSAWNAVRDRLEKRPPGLGPCFASAIKSKASKFDNFQGLLGYVPKKLIDFFDKNMLQLFESDREAL